jgi:hypothetical protein
MKRLSVLRLVICIMLIGTVKFAVAQKRIHIPYPFGDEFIDSELISEVSIVPLEIERYGSITEDMEMKADDENIFILDNRNTQCVFRYNYEGTFMNTICVDKTMPATGNFPILSNPARFSIDPYRNHVEIYKFENSSNYLFNYDGKNTGNFKFTVNPPDYVRDKNGNYWISTGWNNSESQYRLLKTDSKGKITDRQLRLITRCTPTESYSFYAAKNGICFWELLGNTIYSIDDNEIVPRYMFDFGDYNLPLDYHLVDGGDSFLMINQKGYYSIKKFIENDDFAYLALNFNSTDQRAMFHILHDKKSDKINVYTENAAIGAFDKAHHITENNELLFLVSPRKVRNLFRADSEYIPVAFTDIPEQIGRSRTPVVLKMKLRSVESPGQDDEYDFDY